MSGGGERPEELSWTGHRQSAARPYRSDIDGLRAVAVLAVVAFHVKFSAFPGGYIGVDVFFVISGYLIGSIILEEVAAGGFSLLAFYERRVRRIFPALAVLLLLLSVPAYLYLLPNELTAYGGSVLAATFSVSNFYFLLHTGYFAAPAYHLPLLHTWSLAIEEQFYIFLPLFILLLHRLAPRLLPLLLLAATVLSFLLCLRETAVDQAAAFYLPWTRAWELLLGTLIALGLFAQPRTPLWRNIAALAGLALILGPAAAYNAATVFPGANALAPCLGAALIIAAGRAGDSWVARLLSWRPLVFIGRISYSLYLWHWPVIVFMIMSGLTPSTHQPSWLKFLAVVSSVILATLSWRYVETPFRTGPRRPSRRKLFTLAGAAAAALALLGLTGTLSQGLPGRFPAHSAALAGYLDYDWASKGYFRRGSCFLDTGLAFQPFLASGCIREDAKRPSDLILGDSHAAHLWYGLSRVFPGINFLQATSPSASPSWRSRHGPRRSAAG
ncbi:MAG TPA: acyltransferase family protein [Dongiaceae bacterium]